jgi:hypothetical protein
MKIRDIIFVEHDIIDLVESISYIPDDLAWSGDTASFTVNGHKYSATVQPASPAAEKTYAQFFTPPPKVGNVDFSLYINDLTTTQDAVGTVNHGVFKVFGSVAHIVSELINRRGYQIILCIAKRQHSPTNYDQRVSAYNEITYRAAKNAGKAHLKMYETPNETVYAIFDHNLSDGMRRVQQHLTGVSQ